jgi:hypothetical protein
MHRFEKSFVQSELLDRSHSMADGPALVSPYPSVELSKARKFFVAGATLVCFCVVSVIFHQSAHPVALRSRHVLIPDSGLNGPLNPTSAAMKMIAPDAYDATVSTTEGEFTIKVTRNWAPHAADRFFNLASNGDLLAIQFALPTKSYCSLLTFSQGFITAASYLTWSQANF